MGRYLLRRLLLNPITLLGILLLAHLPVYFALGGSVEQISANATMARMFDPMIFSGRSESKQGLVYLDSEAAEEIAARDFWADVAYRPETFDVPDGVREAIDEHAFQTYALGDPILAQADLDGDTAMEYLLLGTSRHSRPDMEAVMTAIADLADLEDANRALNMRADYNAWPGVDLADANRAYANAPLRDVFHPTAFAIVDPGTGWQLRRLHGQGGWDEERSELVVETIRTSAIETIAPRYGDVKIGPWVFDFPDVEAEAGGSDFGGAAGVEPDH